MAYNGIFKGLSFTKMCLPKVAIRRCPAVERRFAPASFLSIGCIGYHQGTPLLPLPISMSDTNPKGSQRLCVYVFPFSAPLPQLTYPVYFRLCEYTCLCFGGDLGWEHLEPAINNGMISPLQYLYLEIKKTLTLACVL